MYLYLRNKKTLRQKIKYFEVYKNIKSIFFKIIEGCKKLNACFLDLLRLPKMKSIVFENFKVFICFFRGFLGPRSSPGRRLALGSIDLEMLMWELKTCEVILVRDHMKDCR